MFLKANNVCFADYQSDGKCRHYVTNVNYYYLLIFTNILEESISDNIPRGKIVSELTRFSMEERADLPWEPPETEEAKMLSIAYHPSLYELSDSDDDSIQSLIVMLKQVSLFS